MKKVLLATTALTLSAGFAAADGHTGVTISGSAEMGIADFDDASSVQFIQDIDVTFSFIGETDNGLSFGTAIDIDEVPGNSIGEDRDDGGIAVFISGDFGTLTLGDTDGAFDFALAEAIGGGSLQDNLEHEGYDGNSGLDGSGDGQVLRWNRNFGDFAVAVSYEQDATATSGAETDSLVGETIGLGVRGTFGDFTVGVGYQDNDIDDIIGVSVSYAFGDFNFVANYADQDTLGDRFGLAAIYGSGPLTVAVNYGDEEAGGLDLEGFGLAVNYDLGGGAEVQFGYGDSDVADVSTWSLGLSMSF